MYLSNNHQIAIIENEGTDCWNGCNHTQGPCQWCGSEGFCCKFGWVGNGCDGNMGAAEGHVCTEKGNHD